MMKMQTVLRLAVLLRLILITTISLAHPTLNVKSEISLDSTIQSLAIHPIQDSLVAIYDWAGTISMLDIQSGKKIWKIEPFGPEASSGTTSYSSIKFSDGGHLLAVSILFPWPQILILDSKDGHQIRSIDIQSLPNPTTRESVVGFSSDNRLIAMMASDNANEIAIINLQDGKLLKRLQVNLRSPGSLSHFKFSSDSKFATGVFPGGFVVWDITKEKIIKSLDTTNYDFPSLPASSAELSSDFRIFIVSQFTQARSPINGYPIVKNYVFDVQTLRILLDFETEGSTKIWFDPSHLKAYFYSAPGFLRVQNLTNIDSYKIFTLAKTPDRDAFFYYLPNIEINSRRDLIFNGFTKNKLQILAMP